MKYLIIAVLASLVFVFVYSRVRPYIQMIRKVLSVLDANVSVSTSSSASTRTKANLENKLVRCSGCGTWIPADRALKLNAGLATFCSRECLEKPTSTKERKLAG